ncbi:MAG: hypothetical protein O2816_04335 [Planctomycetota bacterium]|nr:hypothetical protein [Planctomycetota bacterium]
MHKSTPRSATAFLLLSLGLGAYAFGGEPSEGLDLEDDAKVHWQDKSFAPGDWPGGIPHDRRAEILRWSPLAKDMGYRMDLTDDGRVLVMSSARFNRSVRREARLVEKTVRSFDELMAPQAGSQQPGAKVGQVRDELCVLLRLHDRGDYESTLDFLARSRPYLGPWAASQRARDSFDLRQPNCSAWIERESDRASENQLVHRLSRCMTYGRYGQAPAWLDRGVAWHMELEVVKSIRTLPGAEQERGWERMLKDVYGDRDGLVLDCEDFAALTAKSRNEVQAGMACELVGFLAEFHPGAIGPVLHDLGQYDRNHGQVVLEDGRAEAVPGYEIPLTVQAHVLHRHVDGDVFADCTAYFQEGSQFRMPRAK